jgi:uncharacterized membrane protein YgcG
VRLRAGLLVVAAWLLPLALPVAAAEPDQPGSGPPFPEPVAGQNIYDTAGILSPSTIRTATLTGTVLASQDGIQLVLYTQVVDAPFPSATTERAGALLDEWQPRWPELSDEAIVVLVEVDPSGVFSEIAYAPSALFGARVPSGRLEEILRDTVRPVLADGDVDSAAIVAVTQVLSEVAGTPAGSPEPGDGGAVPGPPPPGPPFPQPEIDRAVYDLAGVFRPETVSAVEATIDRIEERTAAEVVVYTQVVPAGVSTEETERRARALIDQWGVGRAEFDDGLAIFFDFEPGRGSGQVQLYAAPGFAETFLTNAERQAIFENDMLPLLRVDDWDGAILAAMRRIDAAATPENAARLQLGRQLNAVVGLIGAPFLFLFVVGSAAFAWMRYGRDPVYLDSPSIFMPAPPPELTAASGALVVEGRATRRALTTAMLDLASRGLISFREEAGILGINRKVGVEMDPAAASPVVEAQRQRNARRPTGPAEDVALRRLRALGKDGYIEPDELLKFGSAVGAFNSSLEGHVVKRGWFGEKPSKAVERWAVRGTVALVAGIALVVIGANIPMSGLVLMGIGLALAGGIVIAVAQWMPAVTMPGAMIRAMLAAYRRTLKKTMEQARSMDQVVAEAGLEWLDTPDQAVVWGTALGLQEEIEEVLKRSISDIEDGRVVAGGTYLPAWYGTAGGGSFADAGQGGGSIFSSSAVPSIGGMMSALGTIGNSPSSSGGSGGGGFSGGSSGGGGGGAGGGF